MGEAGFDWRQAGSAPEAECRDFAGACAEADHWRGVGRPSFSFLMGHFGLNPNQWRF